MTEREDFLFIVEAEFVTTHEFTVTAKSEEIAKKAIEKHIKNLENLDPWKAKKFKSKGAKIVRVKK